MVGAGAIRGGALRIPAPKRQEPVQAPANRPLAVLMCPWTASPATKHVASHWLDNRPCEFGEANKALDELEALLVQRKAEVQSWRCGNKPHIRRLRREVTELTFLTQNLRSFLVSHTGRLLDREPGL